MGAAVSVFGRSAGGQPNVYAMEQLIARYEELKPRNLPPVELYYQLQQELAAIASTTTLNRAPSSTESEATESPVLTPRDLSDSAIHVLLIDDVVTSLKFSQRLLHTLHFNVTTCTSGERGLEILSENPTQFDLVLLDVLMPGVDGLEVLSRMKMSETLRHIPVVMLSGLDDQGLAEECLQKGAVEVLIKPLLKDAVMRVINTHCKHPTEPEITAPLHGEVQLGDIPSSFTLADSNFASVNLPEAASGKKLILAFVPAAFDLGHTIPSTEMVRRLNQKYLAFKTTNTEVIGICKDLPYSLKAMKEKLGLQFTMLSDPTLAASSHYVGTTDLGDLVIRQSGMHVSALLGYRSPNFGVVILDESKKIIHKWVASLEEIRQAPVLDAQMQKIVHLVRAQESIPPTVQTTEQANVLVVDDATTTAMLVLRKLTSLGHSAVTVQSGERALAVLRQYPNAFDLIFLDIIMPGMDGVELLRILKSDPQLSRIPVVMLSALEDESVSAVCLDEGAMAIMKKPLQPDDIRRLIATVQSA